MLCTLFEVIEVLFDVLFSTIGGSRQGLKKFLLVWKHDIFKLDN